MTRDAAAGDGARPHVLIVEDDPNAANALRVLFHETGHRVTLAHTAASAMQLVAADAPDLLLLDLTLPDDHGLALLDRLRALGVPLGTVVALTGHDDPGLAERCAAHGCADLLTKPVPIRELLGKVEGWLEKGRSTG